MSISISKIRSVAPNATASAIATVSRSMPDSLDEARTKVVEKLKRNIAYINNNMKVADSQSIDLVFKSVANSTYKVGAKYGNRWLPNLLGDGNKFVDGVKKAELVDVINALIEAIENKDADDSIAEVQEAHKKAHSKAA